MSEKIARKLIKRMSGDNGFCFCKGVTPGQIKTLACGVKLMSAEGVVFDEDTVFNIACGEHGENIETYSRYTGWKEVDGALNAIFDNEVAE